MLLRKKELIRQLEEANRFRRFYEDQCHKLQRTLGDIADAQSDTDAFLTERRLHGVVPGGCSDPMCWSCWA